MEWIINLILDESKPNSPCEARETNHKTREEASCNTGFDCGLFGSNIGLRCQITVFFELDVLIAERNNKL